MAIAFVVGRPFVTSAIIGATSMAQLRGNLPGGSLMLSDEVMAEIEAIHRVYTYPCP